MATTFTIPEQIKNYIFSGNKLFVQLAANYLYKEIGMSVDDIQEYINEIGDNNFTSTMEWGTGVHHFNGYTSSPTITFRYNRVFDGDFYKFKLVDNNIEIL